MNYPIYRKGLWHSYKVLDEKLCVEVYNGENSRIQKTISTLAYLPNIEECTEADFLAEYFEVRKKLEDICNIKFDLL